MSIDGKTPAEKETLKISEIWVEISFLGSFSILVGILLGTVDFFESREYMILIISYLSVGLRKNIYFKKIRKIFMGIFFSSNGCKEIVEYVCNFNLFFTYSVIRN